MDESIERLAEQLDTLAWLHAELAYSHTQLVTTLVSAALVQQLQSQLGSGNGQLMTRLMNGAQ